MESSHHYSQVRQHPRFKAIERALVLIDENSEKTPYHIMDISQGGLAFRYLGEKLKEQEVTKASLYHDHELIAPELSVKFVSDNRIKDNLITVRRGSVKFDQLDGEKLSQLERFIRSYTEAATPTIHRSNN